MQKRQVKSKSMEKIAEYQKVKMNRKINKFLSNF